MGKRRKNILPLVLLVVLALSGWYLLLHSREKEPEGTKDGKIEATVLPTPTKCPDSALPTIWMNGTLYRVEPISKSYVAFEEEGYVCSVEREVGYNETPSQELESNVLPVGTKIYKCLYEDDVYIGVVEREDGVHYFRIYIAK